MKRIYLSLVFLCLCIFLSAQDLPDLIISNVEIPSVIEGGQTAVTVTIQNQGQGIYSEDYVSTRVAIDGNQIGSVEAYDEIIIESGESYTYTDEINLSWFPGIAEV